MVEADRDKKQQIKSEQPGSLRVWRYETLWHTPVPFLGNESSWIPARSPEPHSEEGRYGDLVRCHLRESEGGARTAHTPGAPCASYLTIAFCGFARVIAAFVLGAHVYGIWSPQVLRQNGGEAIFRYLVFSRCDKAGDEVKAYSHRDKAPKAVESCLASGIMGCLAQSYSVQIQGPRACDS